MRCKDEDYFSFEAALSHPFIKQYAGILYPTPSDTPEWNRFRALLPLPSRLSVSQYVSKYDRATAQKKFEKAFDSLARILIWKFGADDACKDCSRFFYGTYQKDRVIILGGSLTGEAIKMLRADYEAAHPKPQATEIDASIKFDCDSKDAQERRRLYGEWALQMAKQRIESAPMGQKNKTRARMAYLIGGYCAGGLLSDDYALAELEKSVRLNTDNFSKSWKTIDECFAEGRSEPISFEACEQRRAQKGKAQTKTQESIVLEDGEIIDPSDDPPISDNLALETYCRKVLANGSLLTKTRMLLAVELGFTKLPWRLLNGILSYERNKLSVKVITDEMMLDLYAKNGERNASESTLKRDKKKLWTAQAKIGVELVWYLKGYKEFREDQDSGKQIEKRHGSRYKCNLDRWALEAIAKAITEKGGKYFLKDEELKKACAAIAKDVPRFNVEDCEEKPKAPRDGETIQKSAEESLERIATKFHEAWDDLELTLGERHVRTRGVLRGFGKKLLGKADLSTIPGKRQRKRTAKELDSISNRMADEVLDEVKQYVGMSKSAPYPRTADREGAENSLNRSKKAGGQSEPHMANSVPYVDSTTYTNGGQGVKNSEKELKIECRKAEIRRRFSEIMPADGKLFAKPEYAAEIMRLAEELDDLDRQAALLRDCVVAVPGMVATSDSLIDALLEDMESF